MYIVASCWYSFLTQQSVCYIHIYPHGLYQQQQGCGLFRLGARVRDAEVRTDANKVTIRWAPLRMSVIQVGA